MVSSGAITYAKKPTMKLYFKDEDEEETDEFFIAGDGIDEVSLHVQIDGLNPLDEFGCIYDKDNLCNLQLYINEELIDVEAEQSMDPTTATFIISITSNEPGLVLNIRGNDNLFLTNSVTLGGGLMRLNVQKSKGRLQVGINETAQEKLKRNYLKNVKGTVQ